MRHNRCDQRLSCIRPTKRQVTRGTASPGPLRARMRAGMQRRLLPIIHSYDRSAPMTSRLRSVLALVGATALAVPFVLATPAAAQTKLKLVLNWKYQGPQGMFFLADDRGYFKAERLEVTLDQ